MTDIFDNLNPKTALRSLFGFSRGMGPSAHCGPAEHPGPTPLQAALRLRPGRQHHDDDPQGRRRRPRSGCAAPRIPLRYRGQSPPVHQPPRRRRRRSPDLHGLLRRRWETYREHKNINTTNDLDLERETLHVHDDHGRVCLIETRTVHNGNPVQAPANIARYQY